MHKSSIYLPDDLKRELTERAGASGRSEAELIRHAIERLLATSTREPAGSGETPAVDLPRPALVGVGMGPGDASLVTRRAVATLVAAERVLVVTTDARSIGRAETVVRVVAPMAVIQRVPYRIGADDDREESTQRLVETALAGVDAGELVAVAVLGDPAQWTVFPEVAARIREARPALAVSAVPGITAYQAAAAVDALGLGEGADTLVVTADPSRARRAIDDGDAVVLHKATTDGETIRALATGRDDVVLAELTGLPGQRNVAAETAPSGPLAYLSSLIVPHRRRQRVVS